MINPIFFSVLRRALSSGTSLESDIKQIILKHAVIAVVLEGIKNCDKEDLDIPRNILYDWIGTSEQICQQNKILNKKSIEAIGKIQEIGFRCCILKGQGNALMYPNPLLRTSGDIDLWVDGKPDDVTAWVLNQCPQAEYNYLHIEFPFDTDVPIEIHYRCSYLFNRKSNKLFQTWIESKREEQFSHKVLLPDFPEQVCVPTDEFNRIFQLTHMLRHFLGTGVGFRHLIDYYYLLKKGVSESEKKEFSGLVRKLGLFQFATAVMYVEKEILGLKEECLLVSVDKRRGKILLKHVMSDGNFGYQGENSYLFSNNPILRNVAKLYRLITLIYVCPKEAVGKLIYGKPRYRVC